MSAYSEHLAKLRKEAEKRTSFVSHDALGDAVIYRDIGRFFPMVLNTAFEISVGSTPSSDVDGLRHLDTIYRMYLLMHNGAMADRRDYISVMEELYTYVDDHNAGHYFSLYNAAVVQGMCVMLYTSASVMAGMMEQQPEAIFAHALAQNIITRAPAEVRAAAIRHAQNEGIYPIASFTAALTQQITGIREMLEEDQRIIVERLQKLRSLQEEATDVSN